MGRTNSPEPIDFAALHLPTWQRVSEEDYEAQAREMQRLYKVESAALKVLGTMPRRNGKPSSFTLATFPAIEELDATLQQDEED